MSSRLAINLLCLALVAIFFVVCPEKRTAEKAGRLGSEPSYVLGARSDADLAYSDLADGRDPAWDGVASSAPAQTPSAEVWPGIFGSAFDLDGEPVPGLLIYLSQPPPSHDGLERTTRDLSAVTADDGSFEILVAEEPGALTLGNSEWAVLGEWRERRAAWRIQCDILVSEAVHVLGQVTDSDNRPLAGTEVIASAQFSQPRALGNAGEQGTFEQRVFSDDDGRFDLGPVPLLPSSRIVFDAPGLDPLERRVSPGGRRAWQVVLR